MRKILIIGLIGLVLISGCKDIQIDLSEEEINQLAEDSTIYVSTGCINCEKQKKLMGEYKEIFNIVDCRITPVVCVEKGITEVPTWEINGKLFLGVYSLEEAKELGGK